MRVAIDLSPLYSAHQYRGIGFYTKRLIKAMQPIAKKQGIELELVKRIDKLRFLKADLIHYPYFSPFSLSLPAKPLAPSVVTIHDLIPVKYPRHFSVGLRGRWRWQQQKRRLKKVKAVITDSQAWRQQIADLTGYPLEKVFSIPLAAGKEFRRIKNQESRIKRKYRLLGEFILYVGDVNWNKNLPGLIRAFAEFVKKQPQFKLVLVGKAFEKKDLPETSQIRQLIGALSLNDKVIFLGFVSTGDLVIIYNLASAYCQPSLDEGFGLPVLEAMACGCPVVTAKAGSLPEISGDAAVLVNPAKTAAITQGILKAIGQKKSLIRKGLEQVKKFSWEETARQTIRIYEKII